MNQSNPNFFCFDWYNLTSKTIYDFNLVNDTKTNPLNILINQSENLNYFKNFENIKSIYHYSIPNTKLCYPEPFIASASFMHSDLWFVHILIYQYWLWFIFIFLIIFFFLTFLTVVRWCNMRTRPRRETRGVSRSKCGDLITACVPVSWATSIIVNESTDAIDFYDGFGTTELVVGIRAYQWGWEYYYPKDIDINYNIKKNYSAFIGNSLKYNTSSELNLKSNNLWKFYQNKTTDSVITPAHLLLFSTDNNKLLNFLNFNDLGTNSLSEASAFKKIKTFSKLNVYNTSHVLFFNDKYKNFSKIYFNDTSYSNSNYYGIKRQHTYLTANSYNNGNFTFLNQGNINKLLNYNYNLNYDYKFSNVCLKTNFIKIFNKTQSALFNSYFFNILEKTNFNKTDSTLLKFNNYSNIVSLFNENSDKLKPKYPLLKLLSKLKKEKQLINKNNLKNLNLFQNAAYTKNIKLDNFFFNHKSLLLFSSNQSLSFNEKNLRAGLTKSLYKNNYNLSISTNEIISPIFELQNSIFGNFNKMYDKSNLNWANLTILNKLIPNKIYSDYPFSPIVSNLTTSTNLNYDKSNQIPNLTTSTILRSKEELLPSYITSIYWNFNWLNTNNARRFEQIFNYNKKLNLFYLPNFSFYYDYDFRNQQSFDLLEASIWEASFNNYAFDEYSFLFKSFYSTLNYDKHSDYFNALNKKNKIKRALINDSFFNNTLINQNHYVNYTYFDDFSINPFFLNLNLFNVYPFINGLNSIDDSYEISKSIYSISNNNLLNFINSNSNYFKTLNYSFVFNMFRSDYDDINWFTDFNNNFNQKPFFNAYAHAVVYLNKYTPFNQFEDFNNLSLSNSIRFENNLNLRFTTKNAMVTYSALQKVFKSRFDESRSHTKLTEFSNYYTTQPYISSSRIPYEKTLGKNKETFFQVNIYKNNFYKNFNSFYNMTNSLNFYIFDFPFLLSYKSDSSKHFWFDWFSKWGLIEIQPSSSSRYAIHGMPYFNKYFDFNTKGAERLNESETYLLRISKIRKNYLANWAYTPYFYLKHNSWYKNNLFFTNLFEYDSTLFLLKLNLEVSSFYWKNANSQDFFFNNFAPSISNINSYTKSTWRPLSSISAYYYQISTLIDILTKREYLYRQFFTNTNKITSLPVNLTNSPSNQLITELKSAFLFVDPLMALNEYSKEYHYASLHIFNFYTLKNLLLNQTFVNLTPLVNFFYFYLFDNNFKSNLESNLELYKNQYRPLRKGVNNMLRLHATGAIAMPIEIRLQILASSKDVIHSWAVPSAGIKIDCVPGYSSHKVMIFLVSGIFWGQCMEICGRYHHWMPIVVYFMKRDLFFLWCTHFVFLSGSNNVWNINDRQYTNYVKNG